MSEELEPTELDTSNTGTTVGTYEPPTISPLGTADEAMADIGGFSGF